MYFHSYKTDAQLSIDIVADIRRLNDMSVHAKQAGMIVLGGGVCKHQIANAMLFVSLANSLSLSPADQVAKWSGLRSLYKYWTRGEFSA
jgi:deoxyhypusine synthase